MDESTRDFLEKTEDAIFIYGALIIEKEKVAPALEIYKKIFKTARDKIHTGLKRNEKIKQLDDDTRSTAIDNVLKKFEIHSYELFNPRRNETNKKGEITKYNPWQFIENSDRLGIIETLFTEIKPFISDIFMFQIHNKSFDNHYPGKSIKEKRILANEHITQYVLKELSILSISDNIVFVMDNLDSDIRDAFVKELSEKKYPNLWAEPIIVESHKNAFIQLIDLFTYVFYLDYSNKFEKRKLKRVRNSYRSQIKDLVSIKDLLTYISATSGSAAGTGTAAATTPLSSSSTPVPGKSALPASTSITVAPVTNSDGNENG